MFWQCLPSDTSQKLVERLTVYHLLPSQIAKCLLDKDVDRLSGSCSVSCCILVVMSMLPTVLLYDMQA